MTGSAGPTCHNTTQPPLISRSCACHSPQESQKSRKVGSPSLRLSAREQLRRERLKCERNHGTLQTPASCEAPMTRLFTREVERTAVSWDETDAGSGQLPAHKLRLCCVQGYRQVSHDASGILVGYNWRCNWLRHNADKWLVCAGVSSTSPPNRFQPAVTFLLTL